MSAKPIGAKPALRNDWLSKSVAGTLLGLALGLLAGNYVALFGANMAPPVRAQLAMWAVAPVWLGVLGGVFLFRSGARAWAWLAGVLIVGIALLLAAQRLIG